MKIVDLETHVMSANPFDLIRLSHVDNITKLCHSQYTGPKTILYNDVRQCAHVIKDNSFGYNDLILSENAFKCDKSINPNVKTNYWTKSKCEISLIIKYRIFFK